MPLLDISTNFANDGATPSWRGHRTLPSARSGRYSAGGIILTLLVLALLAASLAVAVWLFWLLAISVLGMPGTLFGVVFLVAATAALRWHTGRSFIGTLILVGFGAVSLLMCWLYGMAGYALIFGG
jgi:hypothetical protein